jgi:hypothetical protein
LTLCCHVMTSANRIRGSFVPNPRRCTPAFKTLTLHEMTVSRVLFAGPSLPDRLVGRNGLPSERDSPPLDQFLDLGFVVLADVPGEELVVGTIDKMRRGDGGHIVTPCNAQQFQAFGKGVREDGRDVPLHRSAQTEPQ